MVYSLRDAPANLPDDYLRKQCVIIPPNFALVERQGVKSSPVPSSECLILNQ